MGNLSKVEPQNQRHLTPHVPQELQPFVDGLKYGFDTFGQVRREWWNPPTCPAVIKRQLPALIAEHERASVPAVPELVILELTRLAAHYPQNRTEQQWTIVFEDMLSDLGETPADILAAAIAKHRRSSGFFPKVSELLAIIEPMMSERRWNIDRMKKLAALPTPEQNADADRREAEHRPAAPAGHPRP